MRFLGLQIRLPLMTLCLMVFFPLSLLAQSTLPVPTPADPNGEFLQLLFASLNGFKGASALAIAGIVVQLVIKLLSTSWVSQWFPNLSGAWKITIVSALSLGSGVLALMVPPASLTLGAALVHSATLTAVMVFANQLLKQFTQPAAAATKPTA